LRLLERASTGGPAGREATLPDRFPETTIPEVGIEPEPLELPDELVDELLAGAKTPEVGDHGS